VQSNQQLAGEAGASIEEGAYYANAVDTILTLGSVIEDPQGLQGALESKSSRLNHQHGRGAGEQGVGTKDAVCSGWAIDYDPFVPTTQRFEHDPQALLGVQQPTGDLFKLT
jgi:hypothetical protein